MTSLVLRCIAASALLSATRAIAQPANAAKPPSVAWMAADEFYQSRGEFGRARRVMENVRDYLRRTGKLDSPDYINSTGRLAKMAGRLGDVEGALRQFDELEEICARQFGAESLEVLRVRARRARAFIDVGNYAAAEPIVRAVFAGIEKTAGPEHPEMIVAASDLAGLLAKTGRLTEAEPLYQRAIALAQKLYGPDHAAVHFLRFDLATGYMLAARIDDAKAAFAQCRGILSPGLASANDREYLSNTAALAVGSGDRDLALASANDLFAAETALMRDIFPTLGEEERLRVKSRLKPVSWFATLGVKERIAHAVLQTKAVTLDALLVPATTAGTDPFADLLVPANVGAALAPVPEKVTAALKRNPTAAKAGDPRSEPAALYGVTPAQVCAALPLHTAVVEFVRYGHQLDAAKAELRYGALVFRPKREGDDGPNGSYSWVQLGRADTIDRQVEALLTAVKDPLAAARVPEALRVLCRGLWRPLQESLPPDVETVFISPDAAICFVPFAALLDDRGRFVAETQFIVYVSSARDLFRPLVQRNPERAIAIFAAPDFGGAVGGAGSNAGYYRDVDAHSLAGLTFPALPGARREADVVAGIARRHEVPANVFVGTDATEQRVRGLVAPRILHFATHAFVLEPVPGIVPPNPMDRSGLALAGAGRTVAALGRGEPSAGRASDGLLTAREIAQLSLKGTWLVTLAACDSGRGEALAGESVLGLRRGFLTAGAENLLLSLWRVADRSTADFMAEFYARTFETSDPALALARTQREWLVRLRQERGIAVAVNVAGPFALNCGGRFTADPVPVIR